MSDLPTFSTNVSKHPTEGLTINGSLKGIDDFHDSQVIYWAANPPDYRHSFSGSALPFVDPEMAFDHTPNQGKVNVSQDGSFVFHLKYPNSYYMHLGNQLIGPQVHLKVKSSTSKKESKVETILLGEPIPFRSLRHEVLDRNVMFYLRSDEPIVRTQEQTLNACGYPSLNSTPTNFWGTCPSHP
jgi:hypothetical protein